MLSHLSYNDNGKHSFTGVREAPKAAALYDADDPDRLLGGGLITAAPREG